MPEGFSNDEKPEIEAFPAGEGADQRMRREADEGYAKTASSVREHPVHFTIAYCIFLCIFAYLRKNRNFSE